VFLIGLFAALAAGGALAEAELTRFEREAAAEVASHLERTDKTVVIVDVTPLGVAESLRGEVAHVSIAARAFSVQGLPLFTEPQLARTGTIRSLEITLHDFNLRGLQVEELRARLSRCRYDFGLARSRRVLRLTKSGEGTGYVRVSERSLERFILHKYRNINRVSVRLDGGRILVSGQGDFGLVQAEFLVLAQIRQRNGTQLVLENARVVLDGMRVDAATARGFLEAINPVIDENRDLRLNSAMTIEEVRIRDGFIELFGTARVPERDGSAAYSASK